MVIERMARSQVARSKLALTSPSPESAQVKRVASAPHCHIGKSSQAWHRDTRRPFGRRVGGRSRKFGAGR